MLIDWNQNHLTRNLIEWNFEENAEIWEDWIGEGWEIELAIIHSLD